MAKDTPMNPSPSKLATGVAAAGVALTPGERAGHRPRWLQALERPTDVLRYLGPNWFASVMGTGIVATAAATLPVHVPGLRVFSQVVWVIAALLLVVLGIAVGGHWLRHPTVARRHARNPQMAHFYGAAPMALLTVGTGSVLLGRDLVGEVLAVDLDWVLWTAGTISGLFTAISIPYLMFIQHNVEPDA